MHACVLFLSSSFITIAVYTQFMQSLLRSHAGQFWNIPMDIKPYVGPYGDGTVDRSNRSYSVTVSYPGSPKRTFIADFSTKDWSDHRPCLYAGNNNGGPIGEVPSFDGVIEGKASDYVVETLFGTDFLFSRYTSDC